MTLVGVSNSCCCLLDDRGLYQCARAAVTKYYRLGWGLNNRHASPHSSRRTSSSYQSKVKVSAELVSSATYLHGFYKAIFSLWLHMVLPLCVSVFEFHLTYKDTGCIGLGPALMASF